MNATIAIIGGGNMGSSLIGGLLANHYAPDKIWVTDPDLDKLEQLKTQFKIHTTQKNEEAIKNADVVLFAVKPQHMHSVAENVSASIQEKKPLVITIAAGVLVGSMQHWLKGKIAIVRCMPNTPALIGCGATGLFANELVTSEQKNLAESILRAVGLVVWLKDEKALDAVTALSGSGPAYFFRMMEVLQNIGEELGLSKDTARLLTLQTAFGAAKMALESPESLESLRQKVTSPGGTTERALQVLQQEQFDKILMDALSAAKMRSEELANDNSINYLQSH